MISELKKKLVFTQLAFFPEEHCFSVLIKTSFKLIANRNFAKQIIRFQTSWGMTAVSLIIKYRVTYRVCGEVKRGRKFKSV